MRQIGVHDPDVPFVPDARSVNRSSIKAIWRIELWPCEEPKSAIVGGPAGIVTAASAPTATDSYTRRLTAIPSRIQMAARPSPVRIKITATSTVLS